MDPERLKKRLEGCYVTIPTPFRDEPGLPVNEEALRTYVRFLLRGGLTEKYATLLAGGAAGDFSTMTFEERTRVAEIVAEEALGRVPLALKRSTMSGCRYGMPDGVCAIASMPLLRMRGSRS